MFLPRGDGSLRFRFLAEPKTKHEGVDAADYEKEEGGAERELIDVVR